MKPKDDIIEVLPVFVCEPHVPAVLRTATGNEIKYLRKEEVHRMLGAVTGRNKLIIQMLWHNYTKCRRENRTGKRRGASAFIQAWICRQRNPFRRTSHGLETMDGSASIESTLIHSEALVQDTKQYLRNMNF